MSNRVLNVRRLVCLRSAVTALAILFTIQVFAQSGVLINTTVTYDAGVPCVNNIAVGDLNADGKPDVVLASGCPDINHSAKTPGEVAVLLGKGNGAFRSPMLRRSGGISTVSVQIVDVNGDGKADLLTASRCATLECTGGALGILLGNGDGTFAPAVAIPTGQDFSIIAVADVNGDGKIDLVSDGCAATGCASNPVNVRLGNGDGTFQPPVEYGYGEVILGIVVADVNHDGKADIVVSRPCRAFPCSGVVSVMLGNGDGTFGNATLYDSGGSDARGVTVADVNGDGEPDIVVVNELACNTCHNSTVGVLLGNGDGTFQAALVVPLAAPAPFRVVSADLNGDEISDVIVAHCTLGFSTGFMCPGGSGIVETILGRSDAAFSSSGLRPSGGVNAVGLAIADVNSDGKPDVLAANNRGESDGNGTLGVILHYNNLLKSTSVDVTSGRNPSFTGESITFTASITSARGAIPNGELVTFFDGVIAIGTAKTSGGIANFATSMLTPTQHTIKAIYSGDLNFKPNAGTIKQLVEKYPSTTTLTSVPNPSTVGQLITLTCHVTSAAPEGMSGKVRFVDGSTGIGTAVLNNGVAVLSTTKLSAGTHSITATYSGDDVNAKSSSAVLNQVVH